MAPERTGRLSQRLRVWLRTFRYPLSIVVFAVGIVLTALALGDFIPPIAATSVFTAINSVTDTSSSGGWNYNLAFAILGPIIFIVGAYLVGAYLVARRKFEHLMKTRSKAEFLRNIPDLEATLWDLTPDDEQRYLAKVGELRIRR
jgi:type II secretory pathway component PulF